MRGAFILIAALVFAAPAAAADRVLKGGGVTLRLQQTECSVAAPLAGLAPQHVPLFHNGSVKVNGQDHRLCWTDRNVDGSVNEGAVYLWIDDDSAAWLDLSGFREDPGV